MQINRLARIVAAAALGASLGFAAAAPAMANSTISINPGNVPTTAAAYGQSCESNLGGGPYADKDVWVFNLPKNGGAAGVFTSVTAMFDTNGDHVADTNVVIDANSTNGKIVLIGTSKAYAITDAGWTLIDATATITGTADKFVLTHTCAAHKPAPSESASTPPPGGGTPGCKEGSTAPECTPGGGTPGCGEGSTAPECNPGPSPSCSSAMPGGGNGGDCTPSPSPSCSSAMPGGGNGGDCTPSPSPSCSSAMPGGGNGGDCTPSPSPSCTSAMPGGRDDTCTPPPASCASPMPGGATTTPCQPGTPGGGGGESGGLPLTGAAVSSIAVGGLALIGTGTALMIRRRRKFVA